jgi:hypothetical protein
MEALLVSPVGITQMIAGKVLAGTAYCLLAAGVLVGFNRRLFVHWEAAILAVLLTTFCAVMIGLLLGILSNNTTTASTWGGLLLIVMVALTVLARIDPPNLPSGYKQVLAWLPGPAALSLFRLSMSGEAPAKMLWTNAGALLTAGLVGYLLVLWRIKRLDR